MKKLIILFSLIALTTIVNAGVFTDLGEGYSKVAETTYNIKWGFVLTAGAILIAAWRGLSKAVDNDLTPKLQNAIALLAKFTMVVCSMFILLQFRSALENIFDIFGDIGTDFVDWVGGLF